MNTSTDHARGPPTPEPGGDVASADVIPRLPSTTTVTLRTRSPRAVYKIRRPNSETTEHTDEQGRHSQAPQDNLRIYLNPTVQDVQRTQSESLPEFDPNLMSGFVTSDDAPCRTRLGSHNGSCASRQLVALGLPNSGFP